ncbi:MAG TPA: glycosyltransferase [Pyrinomonadaceae bacterium]|jgi:cellulose synthase/poly-beta-1,6-N-acetylglucosamine synthase-like glycosyltransferase/peptidoglycan/xylan/chitin deacetylase (PgdA/CDA1 family)/spore germination protein YaaH|nr:glycosyltransferase [Pyrinomonadaceae bacterium]
MSDSPDLFSRIIDKPVFFDSKGKRGRIFKVTWLIITLASTVLFLFFALSLLINPFLPEVKLKPVYPALANAKPNLLELPPTSRHEAQLKQITQKVKTEKITRQKRIEQARAQRAQIDPAKQAALLKTPDHELAIGFYVNWDDSSYISLKRNIDRLDWLVPEWIRLSGDENSPLVLDFDQNAIDYIQQKKPSMPILPLVQNYKNEEWNSGILAQAIGSEAARANLINSLLDTVQKNKFGGLTIDLEEVPESSQADLFTFMTELHQAFGEKGLLLAQAVPFDNPAWDYPAYAKVNDYLMLMAYDQHWSTGEPGPIAGQDWYDSVLQKRMKVLDPARTIICFGNYGYDWIKGTKSAEDVSFQEAVLAARDSLDSPADIKFDPVSRNPYFSYEEEDGQTHTIWFLDAGTAYNQIRSARDKKVAGLAMWRMGSEDPSLWEIFGNGSKADSLDDIATIEYGYDVDFEGEGEILQVKAQPKPGLRDFKTDGDAKITGEIYKQIPSSYVMMRTGYKQGKIALTFDDGPDAEWTPKILDILKQENVKATFFIVGENGQANPDLVRRIFNEGHAVGNHSFTHPNLGDVPDTVTDLELNATQRLIESLTGHSTRLFRAPYFGDAEPRTPDEVQPTVVSQNLGYITVGLHLDPDDWKLTDDQGRVRTADDMVRAALDAAAVTNPEERGSVMLLHDGGGNRQATIEALPRIIHELKTKGYEFTTVADLAGITDEQAMPAVRQEQNFYVRVDGVVFYTLAMGGWLIRLIFLAGIILGISRSLIIGALALAQYLRSRKREQEHFGEKYAPFVSVVVPAYNEEKVICKTIESLLTSDHKNFEIIVVDDGSSDSTYDLAREKFAGNPQIRIFRKENGGKASALNFGWRQASGEIIIALDADTLFLPNTISELIHRFADEKIGAVAGNAKVGNRINIVTKWQALEYITSQNMDRRAFSSLNCITVVPGSVGAWRREILEQTGGFSGDTLAEDQDLTIQIRKLGYLVGYEENAIGLTEAPDTLRGLAKQRFRWSYGTLQCMWKHKRALLNPKYGTLGFIAMPNVWIYQVIFPLISPLMDLMFIWTFVSEIMVYLEHQKEYTPTNIGAVMFYYALFLLVDWLGAFFAFMLEKKEQKNLLWWLFIQRFGYRQVMYWVMVKSVYTAIRGAVVGWGKIERKATVQVN